MRQTVTTALARGRARALWVPVGAEADPSLWVPATPWGRNTTLYGWGAVVARALTGAGAWLNTMYVEYANTGGPAAAPSYGREDPAPYYAGLGATLDRDYLRVPVVSGTVDADDPATYPHGNIGRFFALTAGGSGVHGKPFSSGAGSTVYGCGLAYAPDRGDPSRDLPFNRYYFPSIKQMTKPPGSQVGIEFEVEWQ